MQFSITLFIGWGLLEIERWLSQAAGVRQSGTAGLNPILLPKSPYLTLQVLLGRTLISQELHHQPVFLAQTLARQRGSHKGTFSGRCGTCVEKPTSFTKKVPPALGTTVGKSWTVLVDSECGELWLLFAPGASHFGPETTDSAGLGPSSAA